MLFSLLTILQLVSQPDGADGFVVASFCPEDRMKKSHLSTHACSGNVSPLWEATNDHGSSSGGSDKSNNNSSSSNGGSGTYYDDFASYGGGAGRLDVATTTLSELSFRVHKLSLEEGYTRQLIKSRPRFLPYEECRGWVMAWGRRWESEKEWKNWIATGEKRNSYIPSRPDEYYGRLGKWISWNHFLGIDEDSSSSSSSNLSASEE